MPTGMRAVKKQSSTIMRDIRQEAEEEAMSAKAGAPSTSSIDPFSVAPKQIALQAKPEPFYTRNGALCGTLEPTRRPAAGVVYRD